MSIFEKCCQKETTSILGSFRQYSWWKKRVCSLKIGFFLKKMKRMIKYATWKSNKLTGQKIRAFGSLFHCYSLAVYRSVAFVKLSFLAFFNSSSLGMFDGIQVRNQFKPLRSIYMMPFVIRVEKFRIIVMYKNPIVAQFVARMREHRPQL